MEEEAQSNRMFYSTTNMYVVQRMTMYDKCYGTMVDGQWIHVAEVRDVDKRQYRMYKNGEMVAEGTWAECGGHTCGDSKASTRNLYIAHGYAGKFRGILDEVAILDVVLSEEEIQNIMKVGLDEAFDVSPNGKIATTWAKLKR